MSPTRRRIIAGIITFIVTTALVFIILALFNPPFVQQHNIAASEPVLPGVTPPTDLPKALVYAVIGGGIAVALPYAWKFISGATNMPANPILDEPRTEEDGQNDKDGKNGHRRHRRRRYHHHRHGHEHGAPDENNNENINNGIAVPQ